MADRILSSGASVARALGVRPPQRQTLTTGLADLEVKKQAALDRIAGLGAASAPRLRPPPGSALQAGPDIYYSPSTDRYAAGGMEFGATEYDVALRAMENLQAPTRSPGGDFQRIPVSTLEAYRKSISEGRGLMGNLAVGAQNVGEGIVGGIGRGLQMLGAEGTGQAFVDVGEAIGMSPAEQARSAAIAQRQGLGGQIVTAAVQSAPTLGVAIGAGLAGAAVGGPVGAIAGVALSILPMELQASWEAAEQGGLDTSDPEIQTEILASTLFKTGVQTFGAAYLARGLSPAFRTMLGDVSKRTMGARITRGIGAGALEGSAEAIAQATDRVAFDPELRALMTEGDWAAIAPAFVNRYGTEALVAFGAGFLLGAPLGAIASPEATTQTSPSPRRNVDSGQQIDALSGATLEPQATLALPPPEQFASAGALPGQPAPAGLLPSPPRELPSPPAGLLAPPPRALPAPDTDVIIPPAPPGSVPPAAPAAPAAPEARVARVRPEAAATPPTAADIGLEGPAAEGYNIASLRQGPPAPPRTTPQVFSAGPAESTVQSPFVEPMNALRQQQVARMERLAAEGVAQKRAKEARLEAEQRGAEAWDALVEEQGGVDFIALPARAQEAWINAVAANVGPRGQTLQQYFDALVRAADRADQRPVVRRQQAEATPEPTPPSIPEAPPSLPEGVIGTTKKRPFKERPSELSIRNASKRSGVPVSRLEPVEVPGGWGLRVLPETPTPPTGGKTTRTPPQEGAAKRRARKTKDAAKITKGTRGAVQEQGPEAGAVRQGPETGEGVRGEDTQGQEAAGARVEEVQAEEVTPTPAAPATPTVQRGDSAPRDMSVTEAWDKYVKPFLLVPVDRTIISKGDPATAWKRAIESGRGNISAALDILRDTVSYPVLEAQMILQQGAGVTAVDEDARDMALYNLLDTAFRGDTTGSKAKVLGDKSPVQFAQGTLAEHAWTDADREILLDFATDTEVVAARTAEKPNKQMQALNALLEATGVLSTAENVDADTVSNPASELVDEIKGYNEDPHTPARWEQDRFRELVRALRAYAAENPAAYDSVVEGDTPLYQYLSGDGVRLRAGTITPDARAVDPRTQERTATAPEGKFSRVDYNDITRSLDTDGKPINGPMPAGKQKLATKAFLKRLRNAPRVYSFKDQADLRRRDPALYRRAAAGRPEGDFDTANAAGYSFGDGEVIIFSDRIANEKHLKFVLAHETFGHYGLRGVLPAAEFDTLMEGIYDASTPVQWAVDAAMRANPDLGKAEAVEEYLSDFAAALDTSIVLRVWNAIKNALNRLGVTFGDDSVRYLLDQARRYARSPLRGYPADLNAIAERAHAVETGAATPGRYKSSSDFFKDNRALDELARMGLPVPRSLQEGFDAAGGKWGNFVEGWRGFKSTFLSLHGFDARTNPGLKRLHDILQQATSIAMSQRNTLNEAMRPALNRGIGGFGGMTNAEYARANELLHHARIRAIMALRENPVDSKDPLVVFDEAKGTFTRTAEVERLDNLHRLTFEQARDGFSYTFTDLDSEGNVVGTETITVPGDPNLTKGSRVWLAYEAARKGYIDTELRLLIAQLSAGKTRESTALKEIGSVVPDGELDTAERALMRTAIRRYQELYEQGSSVNAEGAIVYVDSSIETAKEFAKAFNMAVIANEDASTDAEAQARNNAVRQFFDQSVADDVIAQIEAFKKRATFDDRFVVQNKIIGLHTQAMQEGGASDFAKNSIVAQYSPIVRTGDFETRLVAKDAKTGKIVSLDAGYKDGLLYSQFGSRDEAVAFAKQVRGAFGTTTYTVKARNADGQMVDTDVVFEPVVDKVLVEAANPLGVNLNEFVAGLNYFDINLRPEKREEIITAMTNQDAAARRRLRAGLNPGDARDAIAGIAEHIDGRASTIAKVQTRPLIDELMNLRLRESNALWAGNSAEVERLRQRLDAVNADPGASDKVRAVAKREYEEALMMYRETNPEPGVSRKNDALNKAARTLAFLDQNASVNESDFEGSGFISAWRSYTSIIQLGGSLATGLLNPVSVYTNGVPYLASYNSKTAFGGGFGAGRALTEVQRAFKQVGIPGLKSLGGMNTAEFWDGVAASADLRKKYNVTKREAEFIAREIREGRMIPAQSNALVSTSRGRTARGAFSKAIDLWMAPFNLTEQASRRAFGLASFRLEYARQRAGIDPTLEPDSAEFQQAEQAAYDRAVDFAGRAMDTALGDYSVLNRPAFFRAGLPGILYMYKVFPTTSIQMFNNLSFNGKMGMLAALWVLGGVAAFPFAEDFEDLFDTLLQKAGVGEGSVRAWAAKRLEDISPGLSPLVLKGALGNVLPGDIAGRVSLSVIPGTEALLAGSNVTRALEEIAGPMPSALLGSMQFAADLVRAPFSETVTMERVMREAPVTGLRMAADAYAYTQSGAIIDRRGYIVADDVTVGELIARLAGFYPRRAAESFGNVRIINRMADYRREAAMAYRQEWVTARIRNDRERMREIEDAVRDWNNYHRGGPLVINNFRDSAQRAYREATRPATERALRSVPEASRDPLTAIADALTF